MKIPHSSIANYVRRARGQKSKSAGFLSLEMGLVLLVVALAIVAAVIWYRDNLRKQAINTTVNHMLATAGSARSTFGQSNQYVNVTTAIAVSANVIPSALRDGAAQTATNTYGGAITVAPATLTGANDALQINWPNVPADQCIDIGIGVQGELRRLQIAGADVKATDAPINLGTLTAQCESAGGAGVAFDLFVGRN
jgi:type II secretory pathway pseudopilin PulG